MADLDPALASLLMVQADDNAAQTLRTRLGRLAERAALHAKEQEIEGLERQRAAVVAPRHALERDQKRLEDEIAAVRAKADHAETDLYSGRINAPRELQGIQEEIAALRRRIGELEDRVLGLMMELEPIEEADTALAARQEGLEQEAQRLMADLAEAEAAHYQELEVLTARRAQEAAAVPAVVLAQYEQLRPGFGGAAVVHLVRNRCEGCPLAMPAMEVDRIRKTAPGVESCEECGRMVLH